MEARPARGAPKALSCGHSRACSGAQVSAPPLFGFATADNGQMVERNKMSIWRKIFGQASNDKPMDKSKTQTPAQRSEEPKQTIPWDYIRKACADNDAFFAMHKAVLPDIYTRIRAKGNDPILMLVAFEQEKWRALLALLYKRPQNMFLTPESYLGTEPTISNNGYCDVYVAPTVNGNPMQSAVFALEREWLASELAWVKGLPPMFIQLVRDKQFQPDGTFTIAVFAPGGMRVEHLPKP